MYNTYIVYTYKEYMKFARFILALRLKKFFLLLYLLFSVAVFFIHGDMGFAGALYALIYCFLVSLVSLVFAIPLLLVILRRNWNTDKMLHDVRTDMVFNENDLNVTNVNGQTTVKYGDIYKIVETKTNFYIMISAAKGFVVIKDNCSKELIDFIRKLKK